MLKDLSPVDKQYYLQHIVAPRPICFASTVNNKGEVNLSPFSFFNMFSSNPPIIIFSPARRLRDNTTKHTLDNVQEVAEVAVNIVTYDIVQQTSLSSCEYPKGTDEFIKAGLTKEPATLIRPPLVKEAKAKLECRVIEIKSLGESAGAGQLVICEVSCMHISDELLEGRTFLQDKLEHVARLGADWYARITPGNLFKVPKPNAATGIGMDALPLPIRLSTFLNGNQLAQLANVEVIPVKDESFDIGSIVETEAAGNKNRLQFLHQYAARLIDEGKVNEAWQVLLSTV